MNYNRDLYKAIITNVVLRNNSLASSESILANVYKRKPIMEVWVDLSQNNVIKVLDMPEKIKYDGIPVAVF
jgi:hypothetical protein